MVENTCRETLDSLNLIELREDLAGSKDVIAQLNAIAQLRAPRSKLYHERLRSCETSVGMQSCTVS